jgi:hypothetical protein
MPDLNPQPLPPGHEIVVKLPASILFDVEAFHRAQRSVLTRLGCSSCTSGFDILWRVLHQEFVVNEKGEVK